MVCKFSEDYFDYEKGKEITYTCKEKPVDAGYCIFHHPKYWRKNPEKISKKIKEKIIQITKEPIYFIGYNIPSIDLSGLNIYVPVYFTYAKFHGNTKLGKTIFHSFVDFSLAKFFESSSFIKSIFRGNAYFSFVTMFKEANFRLAVFQKALDFRDSEFKETANFWATNYLDDADFSGSEFHSEADFRLSTFNKKAIFDYVKLHHGRFYGAKFRGPVFFRYAKIEIADFRQATFDAKKDFHGIQILKNVE